MKTDLKTLWFHKTYTNTSNHGRHFKFSQDTVKSTGNALSKLDLAYNTLLEHFEPDDLTMIYNKLEEKRQLHKNNVLQSETIKNKLLSQKATVFKMIKELEGMILDTNYTIHDVQNVDCTEKIDNQDAVLLEMEKSIAPKMRLSLAECYESYFQDSIANYNETGTMHISSQATRLWKLKG